MPNLRSSVEYETHVESCLTEAQDTMGKHATITDLIVFYLTSAVIYALLAIAASIEEK